jgi:hypothetical protein
MASTGTAVQEIIQVEKLVRRTCGSGHEISYEAMKIYSRELFLFSAQNSSSSGCAKHCPVEEQALEFRFFGACPKIWLQLCSK